MALRKVQEDVKRQADGEQQKVENWKKDNKVILSIKDLVFKERPVKKLMERYIELYEIKEVVSRDIVKLKLPAPIRVYLVVNISRIEKRWKPKLNPNVEVIMEVYGKDFI